jgi:hypothetical protein
MERATCQRQQLKMHLKNSQIPFQQCQQWSIRIPSFQIFCGHASLFLFTNFTNNALQSETVFSLKATPDPCGSHGDDARAVALKNTTHNQGDQINL